jgi:putative ABC transport system ATP-binding protein
MSGVISIEDLSHAYGAGSTAREVLRRVNLDIRAGEIAIVTGASGAGKTTLLTLCGALRSIQSGEVRVLGRSLRGLNGDQQRALRSSIGFIFQSHNLIEALTAGQNVALSLLGSVSAGEAEERSQRALQALGLAERIDAFPEQLSGGERQRVAVARALVRNPGLILADEPTASLDDRSAHSVKEAISIAARQLNCTVLIVTHDARLFDIADRTLRLANGTLIEPRLHAAVADLCSIRNPAYA